MAWPTTSNPRTEFVTLRLAASEAAELDRAVSSGRAASRSAYVRDAVKRVLAADARKAAKAAHKRTPDSPDTPDE